MSSHHIIREKQEPALLVLGLDNFTEELLGQLLEWAPTLMVTPDTAEIVNSLGIKFDVLIGDAVDTDEIQSDIKQVPLGGDNPATAALKYLTVNGYPAVNIVTDMLDLNDYLTYADQINIVIFHDNQKIYPVTSGYSKWKPAGDEIRILSAVNGLRSTGLEMTGENLFKTTQDGLFSLQFEGKAIFISETIV